VVLRCWNATQEMSIAVAIHADLAYIPRFTLQPPSASLCPNLSSPATPRSCSCNALPERLVGTQILHAKGFIVNVTIVLKSRAVHTGESTQVGQDHRLSNDTASRVPGLGRDSASRSARHASCRLLDTSS
jgi:hypothetical protein